MAIATFRGERNVSEIVDKLYSRLTPLQRKKAESTLIKANPQLTNIRKLPQGAILQVPDLPELRAKTNRSLENPDDQIAKRVIDALDAFSKHMSKQVSNEQAAIKQQTALLKSAKFKKDTSGSEESQALAKDAAKALAARSKNIGERRKKVEASIKLAMKDLKKGLI